jgi:glycosyltransferase involved in cell wall biosynthesis
MKVLHVTRDFPPRVNGGLSNAVGGMVRAAAGRGVDQAVVSFDGYRPRSRRGEGTPAEGVRESGMPVLRLGSPAQLDDARGFARAFAPHVVHVHQAMLWDFASEVAGGAPRIFSLHLLQRLMRELRGQSEPTQSERDQARALDQAELVTAPSDACRDALPSEQRDRAVVLPLAVNDSPAAAAAVERPRPPATVLYVGRFGDVKGTQQLLQAIPLVDKQLPDAHFVVAGGLPDNPKADRRWRRRFAEAAPRAELVGWCSATELAALYDRSTLLVVPSWFETFGLAAAEAMLHGLPVVATDAGALPDLVTPDETGWLVPPRDVDGLAAGLIEALESGRASELGRAAAGRIRHRYLWSQRGPELVAQYRRLCGRL